MFGLFSKKTDEEKKVADSIRALKTLRVSKRGGISLDSIEILESKNFIEASKKAKLIVNG